MYRRLKLNPTNSVLEVDIKYASEISNNKLLGDSCKIDSTRDKIENVNQKDWAKIRKYSNVYEAPCSEFPRLKKPISRAFYKLWEILYDYNIECNSDTLHLCEAPGGFIQATLEYKAKKYSLVKKCHTISLIDYENNDIPRYHMNISNNINVNIIKDYNGDLYNIKNILNIYRRFKNTSIHLITADGGITDQGDFNNKEVSHIRLIIAEILTSLLILKNDGCFILKIFDIFTDTSSHLIYILNYIFTEVYINKPYTSRPTNSEKYIVCKGFIASRFTTIIKNLLIESLYIYSLDDTYKITSLLNNIPQEFIAEIRAYNDDFLDNQIKCIDENLSLLNNNMANNVYSFTERKKTYCKRWLARYKLNSF